MGSTALTHAGIELVPALDVPDVDTADRIVTRTRDLPGVGGYKVGLAIVLQLGLARAVERIRALTELPVVYDHQKAGFDVPSNAAGFASILSSAGVEQAIVFPVAGPTTARAYITALQDVGIAPIVGGELPVPDYARAAGGWVDDRALDLLVQLALELGVTRFVAPLGPAVERVVSRAEGAGIRPAVFVPGIGSPADVGSLAPLRARAELTVIVGRAVVRADDARAAAQALLAAAGPREVEA